MVSVRGPFDHMMGMELKNQIAGMTTFVMPQSGETTMQTTSNFANVTSSSSYGTAQATLPAVTVPTSGYRLRIELNGLFGFHDSAPVGSGFGSYYKLTYKFQYKASGGSWTDLNGLSEQTTNDYCRSSYSGKEAGIMGSVTIWYPSTYGLSGDVEYRLLCKMKHHDLSTNSGPWELEGNFTVKWEEN